MNEQPVDDSPPPSQPTRRALLHGVAVVGAAGICGIGLSACGNGEGTTDSATGGDKKTSKGPDQGGKKASGLVASAKEIPSGGGKVFGAEKVVVTQPKAGEFKAFTAVCTHQGCIVAEVAGDTINCLCHGSKFSSTDGSVRTGPATKPLEEKQVNVDGDKITIT